MKKGPLVSVVVPTKNAAEFQRRRGGLASAHSRPARPAPGKRQAVEAARCPGGPLGDGDRPVHDCAQRHQHSDWRGVGFLPDFVPLDARSDLDQAVGRDRGVLGRGLTLGVTANIDADGHCPRADLSAPPGSPDVPPAQSVRLSRRVRCSVRREGFRWARVALLLAVLHVVVGPMELHCDCRDTRPGYAGPASARPTTELVVLLLSVCAIVFSLAWPERLRCRCRCWLAWGDGGAAGGRRICASCCYDDGARRRRFHITERRYSASSHSRMPGSRRHAAGEDRAVPSGSARARAFRFSSRSTLT